MGGNDELREFMAHWQKVCDDRDAAAKKPAVVPQSFFTEARLGDAPAGPSKFLVDHWRAVIAGSESLDEDYLRAVKTARIAEEVEPSDGLDLTAPPPPNARGGHLSAAAAGKQLGLTEREFVRLYHECWSGAIKVHGRGQRAGFDADDVAALAGRLDEAQKIEESKSEKRAKYSSIALHRSENASRLSGSIEGVANVAQNALGFAKQAKEAAEAGDIKRAMSNHDMAEMYHKNATSLLAKHEQNASAQLAIDANRDAGNMHRAASDAYAGNRWGGRVSEAAEQQGFGKLVRGNKQMTKGDITYETEPITFSSVGPDAGPYDGPVRVSKFSTSDEIDEVAVLKRRLEFLERRIHRADVEMKAAKRDKLVKEMKSLRTKIHEMSEKMQSKPDTDVT